MGNKGITNMARGPNKEKVATKGQRVIGLDGYGKIRKTEEIRHPELDGSEGDHMGPLRT